MNFEKIKSLPIDQVAQWLGLSTDKNNKIRCFNVAAHKHGDIHPSLSLDLSKNRYKCFSCGVSGSNIDLTMGYRNLNLKEAVEELRKIFFGESKQPKEYTLEAIKSWKLSGKVFDELYNYIKYVKVRFRDSKDRLKQDLFFTRTSSGKFLKGRRYLPVLYNEKELQHRPNDVICFTEGESCTNVLKDLGFLATTSGSAIITPKTFTKEMIAKFKDRDVIIFPDNDTAGHGMFLQLTSLIHSEVKTLSLADIETPWEAAFREKMLEKADVKDFVEKYKQNHKDHEIKIIINQMINDARLIPPPSETPESVDIIKDKYFDDKRFVPQYLVKDILKNNKFLYTDKQFYHYVDGFWKVVDVDFIAQIAKKKLGTLSNISRIKESVNDLKLFTLLPEDLKLNNKKELINLKNGMYNFLQEKLVPHDPGFYSSVRINAAFDQSAKCPRWNQFIKETLQPDTVMILQEFFGYCLVPDNRFEKSIILTGSGANGKSVTLSVLTSLIGNSNVAKISLQNLSDRFKTVELYNRLVNIFADMSSQALKDPGIFKMLTSGDAITAERKYEMSFSFTSFCRLIFSCNQLPKSFDKSYAYYRRLIIIPFLNCFKGDSQDPSLKSKLAKELDGVFCWSLQGLHRLFKQQGFTASETTNAVLEDYKLDNNNVLLFVKESCVIGEHFSVDKADLYSAYREFCEQASLRAVSRQKFNHELIDNYSNVRETMNHISKKRAWRGVGINNN